MPVPAMRSEDYGTLQRLVDAIFPPGVSSRAAVEKLDVVSRADMFDLCDDLQEVVDLLPSRRYTRARLCDQLNSIITAHGWGSLYGTVD